MPSTGLPALPMLAFCLLPVFSSHTEIVGRTHLWAVRRGRIHLLSQDHTQLRQLLHRSFPSSRFAFLLSLKGLNRSSFSAFSFAHSLCQVLYGWQSPVVTSSNEEHLLLHAVWMRQPPLVFPFFSAVTRPRVVKMQLGSHLHYCSLELKAVIFAAGWQTIVLRAQSPEQGSVGHFSPYLPWEQLSALYTLLNPGHSSACGSAHNWFVLLTSAGRAELRALVLGLHQTSELG